MQRANAKQIQAWIPFALVSDGEIIAYVDSQRNLQSPTPAKATYVDSQRKLDADGNPIPEY